VKSFPYINFYTAGPDMISDFDDLPLDKQEDIRKRIAETNRLRENFRKNIPMLVKDFSAGSKKSESK